ncbi:class I SAM-dependent methyltransferase [Phytoactinopolyspora halotolerans]|uniref:Class I SAM-dependent methyltransferase n=1 Tax=Phytoactinopolyspora halotolerans TaxID=1981512 RepID=A0A6L9S726_9ACTN|nr:class I SAM-dependent methyltransferase [Phytoactinopolyspora halotolerans]NEE00358.1 class I SAM-dependent methyltransferase [Phytoactinopolyspora halotolerans]
MSRGVIPSPNIWRYPDVYETENLGVDPDGVLEAAMRRIHDWTGQNVVDVGCGSGFHLPRFAADAARVVGVEPHPPLVRRARQRVGAITAAASAAPAAVTAAVDPSDRARPNASIEVLRGTAQALPLPTSSMDVAHARWAYFFGPGCEPGIRELGRVLRRGGTAFVIDNDAARSTFGRWFRRALPRYDPQEVERFWARQAWQREPLEIRWEQPDRASFEAVVRIEFPAETADAFLAEHPGSSVDYAVNLFWRTFP